MMHSLSVLVVQLLALAATVRANPGPAQTVPPADLVERDTSPTRVTTSYFNIAMTPLPRDEYYVGMGKNGTKGNYCQSPYFLVHTHLLSLLRLGVLHQ